MDIQPEVEVAAEDEPLAFGTVCAGEGVAARMLLYADVIGHFCERACVSVPAHLSAGVCLSGVGLDLTHKRDAPASHVDQLPGFTLARTIC